MNGKISVLMGIYNCAATLEEAVMSIIGQTYTNWELIMCDDGSTDGTYDLARSLCKRDDRLILMKNEKNLGLNVTLNKCLSVATGEFVARMDGDDISLPERFEKQIAFLSGQSEYSVVGSNMALFDESGVWGHISVPEYPKKEEIAIKSTINHPTVMMYRTCIEAVNGYSEDKSVLRVEDFDLWIRLYYAGYRFHNIQEELHLMRNDKNAFRRRKFKYRINGTKASLRACKMFGLGFKYYILSFSHILKGFVPAFLRRAIRKKQKKI